MPIIGVIASSMKGISGYATEYTFNSTSYCNAAALSGDTLYGALGCYTGTRRELVALKMDIKTGTTSFISGLYSGTAQGQMSGTCLTGTSWLGIGYMGGFTDCRIIVRTASTGAITRNEGIYFGGSATSTSTGGNNALVHDGTNPWSVFNLGGYSPARLGVLKFNNSLGESLAFTLGHQETNYSYSFSGIAVNSNFAYVMGYGIYTDWRGYIAKIDKAGQSLSYYYKINADSDSTQYGNIAIDSSNNVYIIGRNQAGTKGGWIGKFTSGSFAWQKNITIANISSVSNGTVTVDNATGDIYASWTYNLSSGDTYEKALVVKFDSSGNITWQRIFYTPNNNYAQFYTIQLSGTNLVMSGSGGANADGSPRPMVVVYPQSGLPSAVTKTLGPMTNWTIATGGVTASNASKTATSITGVFGLSTTSLNGTALSDNTPTYSSATITF